MSRVIRLITRCELGEVFALHEYIPLPSVLSHRRPQIEVS